VEADQLYKEGKLSDAITSLQGELRSNPNDVPRRTFLFELLCFQGKFDRAWKQLEVIETADPSSYLGTTWFKQVIRAEEHRQEMFRKGELPDRVEDGASGPGVLNGEAFSDIRDADPRIGPRLEVIAGGRYVWIPFSELSAVTLSPPKLLRDLYWASGEITSISPGAGEAAEVLLPAMTALAWQSEDEMVQLGRLTEWAELGTAEETPIGQKLLLVDDEDFPFLEIRELKFDRL
jgi:type VI secretion system protein ImpE